MKNLSIDLVEHHHSDIELSSDGYVTISVEVEFGLIPETPIYIEAQLLSLKDDVVLSISDSYPHEVVFEHPRVYLSDSFHSGSDQIPDTYAINFRYFTPEEKYEIDTPIPPEIARQSGAYLIHTPKKGLLSREKWVSGAVSVDSIIVKNVAGEDDEIFANVSSSKPVATGFQLTCQSGDSNDFTIFKIFDKPQVASNPLRVHLTGDVVVAVTGFVASDWATTEPAAITEKKQGGDRFTETSPIDEDEAEAKSTSTSLQTIHGSITAITVQRVENSNDLGWVSASSGSLDGPAITFYVAFDSATEDYYLISEGRHIWVAAADEHSWEAPKYALENLRPTFKQELHLSDEQIDDLIFYLQANITDESDDIDDSQYTHHWIPRDDAGEVDASNHFSDASDVANRVWISTAQNLTYSDLQLDNEQFSIEFDSDLLEEKEIVSWTKNQLAETPPDQPIEKKHMQQEQRKSSAKSKEKSISGVEWFAAIEGDKRAITEELNMALTRFENEAPDEDGDISIDLEFEIKNESDKDISLIKYDLVIEQEGIGTIGGQTRNTEDCLLDAGEKFNGSCWLRLNQHHMDRDSSEVTVKLYARVYEREFFKLGSIEVPTEANTVTTLTKEIDSNLLDSSIVVGIVRRPDGEEDSNEDRLEFKAGVTNKSEGYLEDLELRLVLMDRTGAEDDNTCDTVDTLGPHSGTFIEPSFWGKPKSKLKGATVDVFLKAHRLIGTQVISETRTLSG